jgi:hypothetical protein
MIKWLLYHPVEPITVTHPGGDAIARYTVIAPSPASQEDVTAAISKSSGAYGHMLGLACLGIDLKFAMRASRKLREYKPVQTEGETYEGEVYVQNIAQLEAQGLRT